MASLDDLNTAVGRLKDSVTRLLAAVPAPADFQPQVDELNALADQADAVAPPPAPVEAPPA